MKFQPLSLVVDGVTTVFSPYDRGVNGAFVYRQDAVLLNAPRVVVSTTTNDAASDKYVVQLNTPRVLPAADGCCDPAVSLGTDVVKTELRFLATTTTADRNKQIDLQIAALKELQNTVSQREHVYA